MKIIIIVFLMLICCGCDKDMEDIKVQKSVNDEYIEVIPENALPFIENFGSDDVILNNEKINVYNENIREKTDTLYDLNVNEISKSEILDIINSQSIPNLPQYNGNEEISYSLVESILNNRNIENVKDIKNIQKGIIVSRSNLRNFPTNIHFYDNYGVEDFDNLQETAIVVNTPVLIIHESTDKLWSLVITPICVGWIENTNIAYATDEDWDYFVNNMKFGVITDKYVEIDNIILDMGVVLPYNGVKNDEYSFIIPVKDDKNNVDKKIITIPRSQAHIGYLPYTKNNLIIEAFKYENEPYSWGGMDKSVDCSSFVMNVYKTFGFIFPRNSNSQSISVGDIIDLSDKDYDEKLEIFRENPLSLIYMKGHVMIYLGNIDNEDYVIHSFGNTMKVEVSKLSNISNYVYRINKLIRIK